MTQAQTPEAMAQECADYATSLRSTAMVIQLEGRPAPASFIRAADLFERASARITQLEAKLARLQPTIEDNSQDWERCDPAIAFHLIERHSVNWADAGKMMTEFAEAKAGTQLRGLREDLTTQTNRAAAAEQQVVALTQRLDMANRLGNDARAELAQLRQAGATADNHIPDAGRMVPHLAKTETCACCGEGVAYLSIIRVCDTCTSEYTGYNESKLLLAAASPTPPAQQKYRLLERGVDVIEPTDEFLQEDGVSWVTYSIGIVVGMTYRGSVLLPARRPLGIETAHGIGASNDSAT